MFPHTGKSYSGLNTNSENDSTGIIDSCPGCGWPHTLPTQLQKSAKLKISH